MAYIKIFPIKSTVDHAVKYITNPNKTDSQNLVSSFACAPETAAMEFAYTEEMGKRNNMDKGDNLAWHMIINCFSFPLNFFIRGRICITQTQP